MATRKNPKVSLPKQWTNAQVRVNSQGKVQVKISRNKINPSYQDYLEAGRKSLGFKPKKARKRGRVTSEEMHQRALARAHKRR